MSKNKPKPTPQTNAVDESIKNAVQTATAPLPTPSETPPNIGTVKVKDLTSMIVLKQTDGIKELAFEPIVLKPPNFPICDCSLLGAIVECSFEQYCASVDFLDRELIATVRLGETEISFTANSLGLRTDKMVYGDRKTATIGVFVTGILTKQ